MWTCPNCQKHNKPDFDLCSKCASSRNGEVDPFMGTLLQWYRRAVLFLKLLPIVYVSSYFLLGTLNSGMDHRRFGGSLKSYAYNDRAFPFDPWIYKPIAKFEYWIRGSDSQVLIKENYRGGEPTYGYGPFE